METCKHQKACSLTHFTVDTGYLLRPGRLSKETGTHDPPVNLGFLATWYLVYNEEYPKGEGVEAIELLDLVLEVTKYRICYTFLVKEDITPSKLKGRDNRLLVLMVVVWQEL